MEGEGKVHSWERKRGKAAAGGREFKFILDWGEGEGEMYSSVFKKNVLPRHALSQGEREKQNILVGGMLKKSKGAGKFY
jgi:hypothetical protein